MFLDNGISDVVSKMRIIYSVANWNLIITFLYMNVNEINDITVYKLSAILL